ncbi:MAG: arginine repressor [Gemmatimonadaceae bacterium]
MDKRQRHRAILDLVQAQVIASQEELRSLLKERGWAVTQSTLSRDLRELRLARIPTPEGPRYASSDAFAGGDQRALVEDVLPQFFAALEGVGELIVVKTMSGGAQPVAEAIDAAGWPEIIGTLGGENVVLVICRSAAARERVEKKIQRVAKA